MKMKTNKLDSGSTQTCDTELGCNFFNKYTTHNAFLIYTPIARRVGLRNRHVVPVLIERGSIDQFIVSGDRHFHLLEPVPLNLSPGVFPLHPLCEQTSTGLNWHFVLVSSKTGT